MTTFKKNKSLSIKIDDSREFPEFLHNNVKTTTNLNFLEASQKIVVSSSKEETIVKPGWVKITMDDKNNSIIYKDNDTHVSNENDIFQESVDRALSTMNYLWERYKKNYEDLNGEDAYEYNYSSFYYIDYTDQETDE